MRIIKAKYLRGESPINQLVDAQHLYTQAKVEALNSQNEFFKELLWVQRGLVSMNWTKPHEDAKKFIDKITSNNQDTQISISVDYLVESIYDSIKSFEKEAITAGREYSRHKMNQCIAVSIYGVSLMSELKSLIMFAAFVYITLVLRRISKKFPKKA